MSLKNNLINLFKGNVSWKDVYYYIQGNFRHKLYYSKKWKFLLRKHIREQITFRILVMRRECLSNGECIYCGCSTTALQMCNKVCEGTCYPPMMKAYEWSAFQKGIAMEFDGWFWKIEDDNLYQGRERHLLVHVSMLGK